MLMERQVGGTGGLEGSGLGSMAGTTQLPPMSGIQPNENGFEVTFGEPERTLDPASYDHYENLVSTLDRSVVKRIGADAIEGFDADINSRSDWETTLVRGLDLMGLRLDEASEPFTGACMAVHPLIIENAVKFAAKAIAEIFPAGGPVKTQILGMSTPEIIASSLRVKDYMNYQLTEEMEDYFDEVERMLVYLAYAGMAMKKTYFNAAQESPRSEFVKATDFVISNYATNLKNATRYSHRMFKSEVELQGDVKAGVYEDVDLGEPTAPKLSEFDERMNRKLGVNQNQRPDRTPGYTIIEQHTYLDIDDSGTLLPYILTVEYNRREVLSLRRNWDQQDKKQEKLIWFTKYSYVPSDGFYSWGLIHLVGSLAKTATLIMRELVDAGQFANLQGGWKLKGLKIANSATPHSPGEYKEVEIPNAMKLSDAIVPHTFKEPSQTLFTMLEFIVNAGQKFADTTDMVVSDSTSYGPVGTILALLDASSKFFSAIHKRLHKSLRDELKILKRINKETLPKEYPYDVEGAARTIYQADFSGQVNIIPVSDPNIATQGQRTAIAQALVTSALQAPQIHDLREAFHRVYTNMGIQDIDKVLPPPPQAQPSDPLTDLQSVIRGLPIQAFPGQDHASHIAVKSTWLQDPTQGGSPLMQKQSPLVLANVQEHMIQMWTEQVTGLTQQSLQGVDPKQVPPQVMGKVMSDAATKVMQANNGGSTLTPDQQIADAAQSEAVAKIGTLAQKSNLDAAQLALRGRELDLQERKLTLEEKQATVDATAAGMEMDLTETEGAKDRSKDLVNEAIRSLTTLAKPVPTKGK